MKAVKAAAAQPATDPVEAVARFVAGFTHRIKSPLTGIKGYGQLMEQEEDRVLRRYWCQKLQGGLECLDLMVEGLGRYQVPEQLSPREVSASRLVAEAWRLALQVTPGATAKQVLIEDRLAADDVLHVDPLHFRNLLINLFQNALDASPAAGRVRVTRLADDELLGVEDAGPGLGELGREQLIRPFFTTRPDRAGLGLAVAEQIAAEHGLSLEWQELQPTGLRARIVKQRRSPEQRSER